MGKRKSQQEDTKEYEYTLPWSWGREGGLLFGKEIGKRFTEVEGIHMRELKACGRGEGRLSKKTARWGRQGRERKTWEPTYPNDRG